MTGGFAGLGIACDSPTDGIWRVGVYPELLERRRIDPARVKIKGLKINRTIRHDGIQHFFGGLVVWKHRVYPVSAEHPWRVWIFVCPRFDPTLDLLDALGVAQIRLEHGGTGQRHMHMTINETRQNKITTDFDALRIVASNGRGGLRIAHEDYSVAINNDSVRPGIFSVRGENAPPLKNSPSSGHVFAFV